MFSKKLFGLFFLVACVAIVPAQYSFADKAADAERQKALANPYPNDFGPGTVDVSKYTPEQQEGYKLMQDRCAKCHTPSRPLNSQFLDLKPEEIAAVKAKNPEIFANKQIWQPESGIWQRYIKRMMAKPGCNISTEDGKKIWKFIVEYSKREKTGTNAVAWKSRREKLVADFKVKYPARYKELFEAK